MYPNSCIVERGAPDRAGRIRAGQHIDSETTLKKTISPQRLDYHDPLLMAVRYRHLDLQLATFIANSDQFPFANVQGGSITWM